MNKLLLLTLIFVLTVVLFHMNKKENFENWEHNYYGWFDEVKKGINIPEIYKRAEDSWVWPY